MDKIKASQFADLAYYSKYNPLSLYQKVAYIEGTGTQYIETGIIPTTSAKAVCEYQFTTAQSQVTDNVLFYIDNGGSDKGAYGIATTYRSSSKGYVCGWGIYATIQFAAYPDMTTTQNVMTISNGVFKLNDTTICNHNASLTWNKSIYLFGWNRNGSNFTSGKVKIYRFTYYTNASDSSPSYDFIPCYRRSDNKTGMYELVTNTFYANAGTGEFTVGGNV